MLSIFSIAVEDVASVSRRQVPRHHKTFPLLQRRAFPLVHQPGAVPYSRKFHAMPVAKAWLTGSQLFNSSTGPCLQSFRRVQDLISSKMHRPSSWENCREDANG